MPSGAGGGANFSPATVTVVVGVNNTIVWTNQDTGVTHNVDFQTAPSGFSIPAGWQPLPNLKGGQSTAPITLTVPGTYTYVCDYHNWMKATIVVLASH
jgi:plastocyanin